ncbi:hypothetical protein BJX76DRAFT_365516 [Aspergillus varians]
MLVGRFTHEAAAAFMDVSAQQGAYHSQLTLFLKILSLLPLLSFPFSLLSLNQLHITTPPTISTKPNPSTTMSALKALPTQILSNGTEVAQKAFTKGTQIAATYGKPALEGSAGALAQAAKWTANNPLLVVSGAVFIVPTIVVAPTLSCLGFGAAGVQASSIAAGAQTANVAVGSLFATLQSAGAGGAGLAAVNGVVQTSAAGVGIAKAGWTWMRGGQ